MNDKNELVELGLSGKNIIKLPGKDMKIAESAYVNPYALIIGEVDVGEDVTIWPGAILRADETKMTLARGAVVLDRAFIEATKNYETVVGEGVMVSHGAIIHGATIGAGALIGIGTIVLDGATIGEGAIVGAGSVVKPGTKVSPGTMVAGIPAVEKRKVTDEEKQKMPTQVEDVRKKAREYGAFYLLNKGL